MTKRGTARRVWRGLVRLGSLAAAGLTVHTALNLRELRQPAHDPAETGERVTVLLPVRDEAARVAPCLASLLDQIRVPDLEIVVIDDGSTDGTAGRVRATAGDDPRVRVIDAGEPPQGWLGKPNACHAGAEVASGSVLVFVDADVRFSPHALASAVNLLRKHELQLVSPYPRQLTGSPAERLVQPLLQWSWLTTLPLALAERSPRASLGAANGQFLVVDAEAYRAAGGHAAPSVRGAVLDDLALLRAVKATGGRGGVVDGTRLAVCRMYGNWAELRDGYTKSLWSAFGSRAGAGAVVAGLGMVYLVPPVAALTGSLTGFGGYLAGVLGRYLVAERTGGRSLPDALAHPASVAVFGWLVSRSLGARRRGELSWRGRPVGGGARPVEGH
ncbi:glycosyltransferase [Kineosporia sp. J2-2]|uniref:Glycosyltransferase n=1 Tax=Kineosporia corallincola TaxID=2835133 RepID=A0ABS5TIZ9_9ACTN|nr:glycosyltransferase family 2 protein [Kineosporia corallincola]MBT0771065.1 glycosyltransferase [Kineosporia corallincola]